MSDTKEQIERNKRLLAAKVAINGPPPTRRLVDADLIKGKEIDDSEIGDGKALTYSGAKDKIVYKRVRGGGGGGGGTISDWTYLVEGDGLTTVVYDIHGTSVNSGETATMINWAFTNLTVGRTWKEKVVAKGNLTISATLNIPSYTVFEIMGQLVLGVNNVHVIRGNNVQYVEIRDGEIDGNRVAATHTIHGIQLDAVSHCIVDGVYIHHTPCCNIQVGDDCHYVTVSNCRLEYSQDDFALAIYAPTNRSSHITVFNSTIVFAAVWSGINVHKSDFVSIIANRILSNTQHGIYIDDGAHNKIIGNTITLNGWSGIQIDASSLDLEIEGNHVYLNVRAGIECHGPKTIINGNHVFDNVTGAGGYQGIMLISADDLVVTSNESFDSRVGGARTQRWGIYGTNPLNRVVIANNNVYNNLNGSIGGLTGTGITIENNSSYNPVGSVATPWSAGAGYITDSAGAQNNPSTATLYTVSHSPKTIILTNCAGISAVEIDGIAVAGITTHDPQIYFLKSGQTIKVTWATTTPNGQVYAQ